jgi:predicted dehydrogenase
VTAEPLKVGIIGAGGIALHHGMGWAQEAERARIVAVADVSEPRARALSDRYAGGAAKLYGGIEDLLADPAVEAVDICLPHHLHTPAILAAARAGKAILCEKPLCTSLEDAAAIGEALRESGVVFVMAHNQLFQPAVQEALRLLGDGALGKLLYVRSMEVGQQRQISSGKTNPDLAPGESPMAWRFDPARMGGGEVLDTGWHGTYRLLALAGERPVAVTATMGRLFHHGLSVEDTGSLTVQFESGLIGDMLTSWAFGLAEERQFEAAGEQGALTGSGTELVHQLHHMPAAARASWPWVHTFSAEIAHFVDVLRKGVPPRAGFAEGARTLQLIRGAYLSAQDGRTAYLPDDPLAAPTVEAASVATPA